MLLAVIVPKRSVSETIAAKHCYWNTRIPVAETFAAVIATERLLEHPYVHAPSATDTEIPQLSEA